ncbi:Acyl-CoA N-acyltransferases superfamily protein isoform 2 [Theobroma cacao]|uniref:Acyl-CoA N-acyltransferases superfamily protein isoform 2 n=1 Tax=Theobroma cacao TaxID=3641 RepID=A0A061GP36_THECC|nr:Acyl-CoA N-acyltransferases superfamily protein isoform 2 [Theobroma cacao]
MALLSLPSPSFSPYCVSISFSSWRQSSVAVTTAHPIRFLPVAAAITTHHHQQSIPIDKSSLIVAETASEDQLWAAACLRVRSFYDFQASSYGIQDHKMYLAEREFEALKERIAGKREGFKKVSCINATLPLSQLSNSADELCAACKGIEADFARAYLSNVCVARELHRNGLGYEIVMKSKIVAQEWGITDLYVHVAVDNEPAKNLYTKSGFVHENDEPAWQARFLDRPRRILLWIGLPCTNDL